MAQSNAISPFILSVSDQVEKGIADIKHQLRRRGGGTRVLPCTAQFTMYSATFTRPKIKTLTMLL